MNPELHAVSCNDDIKTFIVDVLTYGAIRLHYYDKRPPPLLSKDISNQIKSNQIYLTTQKSKINKQMKMKK